MAKKKSKRVKTTLTPEQKRNADIFRLRGFYANAKTLPFRKEDLLRILQCVDNALIDLGAESQTNYMQKKAPTHVGR
jgi:hypothetical protein